MKLDFGLLFLSILFHKFHFYEIHKFFIKRHRAIMIRNYLGHLRPYKGSFHKETFIPIQSKA
jgi:hypothetical protein